MRIVFCGGCNPAIDRTALAAELQAQPDLIAIDATVYVSGCARSCANEHALTTADERAVLVAGEFVDGVPTSAAALAAEIRRKLQGVADGLDR